MICWTRAPAACSCARAGRCGNPCFASHARVLGNVCSGLFHGCGEIALGVAGMPEVARTRLLAHLHAQLAPAHSRRAGGAQARAGRPCRSSRAAEAIPLSTGGLWCLRCWIRAAAWISRCTCELGTIPVCKNSSCCSSWLLMVLHELQQLISVPRLSAAGSGVLSPVPSSSVGLPFSAACFVCAAAMRAAACSPCLCRALRTGRHGRRLQTCTCSSRCVRLGSSICSWHECCLLLPITN